MTDTGDDDRDGATAEPKGGRPGPKDEGRHGGMATREVASDPTTDDERNPEQPPD